MNNSTPSCPKCGSLSTGHDKYGTKNSFANSAIILLDFPILENTKTFLFIIPNVLLVVNLRMLFKNLSYIVMALGGKACESTLCINAICLSEKVLKAQSNSGILLFYFRSITTEIILRLEPVTSFFRDIFLKCSSVPFFCFRTSKNQSQYRIEHFQFFLQ